MIPFSEPLLEDGREAADVRCVTSFSEPLLEDGGEATDVRYVFVGVVLRVFFMCCMLRLYDWCVRCPAMCGLLGGVVIV